MEININEDDFGSVCIFAVRYCQGRRTYAPSIILQAVLSNLDKFSDKTIGVLINDYEYEKRMSRYALGDPQIDAPMWETYAKRLREERARRLRSK